MIKAKSEKYSLSIIFWTLVKNEYEGSLGWNNSTNHLNEIPNKIMYKNKMYFMIIVVIKFIL